MHFIKFLLLAIFIFHHSPTHAKSNSMTMKKLKSLTPTLTRPTCLDELISSAHLRHVIHPLGKTLTLSVGEAIFLKGENLDELLNQILTKAPDLNGQVDSTKISLMLEKLDIEGSLCDGSLVNPKRIKLSRLDGKIPNGKEIITQLIAMLRED